VLAAAAGRRALVLDGEIVALSVRVRDFTLLQRRMTAGWPGARPLAAVPVTLIVFDALRSGCGRGPRWAGWLRSSPRSAAAPSRSP